MDIPYLSQIFRFVCCFCIGTIRLTMLVNMDAVCKFNFFQLGGFKFYSISKNQLFAKAGQNIYQPLKRQSGLQQTAFINILPLFFKENKT